MPGRITRRRWKQAVVAANAPIRLAFKPRSVAGCAMLSIDVLAKSNHVRIIGLEQAGRVRGLCRRECRGQAPQRQTSCDAQYSARTNRNSRNI
jgi:hypothetical protein